MFVMFSISILMSKIISYYLVAGGLPVTYILALRISFQMAIYYSLYENWNPEHNKPIFSYKLRQIRVKLLYLYLTSLQDHSPVASMWSYIVFDVRIKIMILTNSYLDIHQGIMKCNLYICTSFASKITLQHPLGGQIPFLMWILKSISKKTNTETYMKEYWSVTFIPESDQPPGSASK